MRFAIAVVCLAAVAAASATAATQKARIFVTATSPASVGGTSFKPRERVTVTVWTNTMHKKAVTANASGAFKATFAGLGLPRCQSYTVRARGDHGSVAILKVIPECPPPAASEQPLVPADPKQPH
jgi:hypothetical protein